MSIKYYLFLIYKYFFTGDLYRVIFYDGVEYEATVHRIRGNLQVGATVKARYADGRWYKATITDIPSKFQYIVDSSFIFNII